VVSVGLAALRPVAHRGRHRAERARVQALLHEHGASSVSAFALAPDTDYYFSSNGRAVIAYRFESDTLLAIGDPIGPAEELEPLLRAFQVFCAEHDWSFAFFQTRPELLPLYRSLGWRAIHVGEDPMLVPASFTLEGSAMGDARRATRKLEEAGYVARHFVPGDQPFDPGRDPDALLHQMQEISADWMRGGRGEEKGFCMGRFDPGSLRESWLAVAWNAKERRAAAFVTWVPIWARRGWALDLMRRREEAPAGIMDFLVVKSVEAARARGDAILSLSLSALSKVDEPGPPTLPLAPPEAAAVGRARQLLAQHLARFYNFQGLFQWKKKFLPAFEDRYLVYPDPIRLPRVALALARVQSPGGLGQYLWQKP
jgi:phosphatidylglycerol lysyltransferase